MKTKMQKIINITFLLLMTATVASVGNCALTKRQTMIREIIENTEEIMMTKDMYLSEIADRIEAGKLRDYGEYSDLREDRLSAGRQLQVFAKTASDWDFFQTEEEDYSDWTQFPAPRNYVYDFDRDGVLELVAEGMYDSLHFYHADSNGLKELDQISSLDLDYESLEMVNNSIYHKVFYNPKNNRIYYDYRFMGDDSNCYFYIEEEAVHIDYLDESFLSEMQPLENISLPTVCRPFADKEITQDLYMLQLVKNYQEIQYTQKESISLPKIPEKDSIRSMSDYLCAAIYRENESENILAAQRNSQRESYWDEIQKTLTSEDLEAFKLYLPALSDEAEIYYASDSDDKKTDCVSFYPCNQKMKLSDIYNTGSEANLYQTQIFYDIRLTSLPNCENKALILTELNDNKLVIYRENNIFYAYTALARDLLQLRNNGWYICGNDYYALEFKDEAFIVRELAKHDSLDVFDKQEPAVSYDFREFVDKQRVFRNPFRTLAEKKSQWMPDAPVRCTVCQDTDGSFLLAVWPDTDRQPSCSALLYKLSADELQKLDTDFSEDGSLKTVICSPYDDEEKILYMLLLCYQVNADTHH